MCNFVSEVALAASDAPKPLLLLVDPMLMSGKWLLFCILLSAKPLQAGTVKPNDYAKKTSALAYEQQRSFESSRSGRAMPSEIWFVNQEFNDDAPSDPMKSRWITSKTKSRPISLQNPQR